MTSYPSHAERNAAALRMLSPGTAVGHANPELAGWSGTVQANRARRWARPETGDVWVVWDGDGKGNWYAAGALTIAGFCPDCLQPAHYVLPAAEVDSWTDRTPGWYHDEAGDRLTCWAAKAAVAARQAGQPAIRTVTRGAALAWLASLPGYSELTAANVLHEAGKAPYLTTHDDLLFVAATAGGRFVFAVAGVPFDAAGAELAALLAGRGGGA